MASGHVNRANKAEHMAAPHRFCDVKIFLANSEPSTHGPIDDLPRCQANGQLFDPMEDSRAQWSAIRFRLLTKWRAVKFACLVGLAV